MEKFLHENLKVSDFYIIFTIQNEDAFLSLERNKMYPQKGNGALDMLEILYLHFIFININI